MKLQKIGLCLLIVSILLMGSATIALANPVEDIHAALTKAGVPADQTGKITEYLQTVTISDAQANAIIAKIDEVQAKLGGQTDLTKLSPSLKNDVKNTMIEAANSIGLTVDFAQKNSQGGTVLTVLDKEGNTLVSLDSTNAKNAITALDVTGLKDVVAQIKTFSNNPDKAKFNPVTGAPMKQTATSYGNILTLGLILILIGLGAMAYGKKLRYISA